MRVTLLRPNHRSHLIQPPLGLGYLSAVLKARGHDVHMVDGLLDNLSNVQLVERCLDSQVVGISAMTAYHRETAEIVRLLKPTRIPIVLGGPHASALPHECITEGADYVICFEGEELFPALLEHIEGKSELPSVGIATLSNSTPARPDQIKDLDALPFPDWSDMEPRRYPSNSHGGLSVRPPVAPITSTRGCPYNCHFCASPFLWDRKIRFRSPANVVDEMEYLRRKYGVGEIIFEDDNFTMKRNHAWGVCEEIRKRDLDMPWSLPNGIRADRVDKELLVTMKKSGCWSLAFGVESADPTVLATCQKPDMLEHIEQAAAWASEAGIITQGFFVFGLPGETPDSMERTIKWACKSKLDKGQFLIFDSFPGSKNWNDQGQTHFWTNPDYDSYHDVTWLAPALTVEQLRKAQSSAFRRFFLSKPSRIWKMLRLIRKDQWWLVARRMADFRIAKKRGGGQYPSLVI